MAERIDAHHHLWQFNEEEYGWLRESGMAALERDFLVADLEREMAAAGMDGAVAVQARQTMEETRWLLGLAKESKAIRGVVGWAPIAAPEFPAVLEELRADGDLKGLRHVIQGEPDENYILREDLNAGIRRLRGSSLVYDILIFERHLPQTIRFVDAHPEQCFVLDHVGKPRILADVLEPWATNIRELARRENVWCKVSGMVTEADWKTWSAETLRPYLDVVTEAFGPQRLMAGSDWPVCLAATGYKQWFEVLEQYVAKFSFTERDAILGGTAKRVYGL